MAAADSGATGVLEALHEAVEDVRDVSPDLRVLALRRLAEAHGARYRYTADPAELDAADRVFAQAQGLVQRDDPVRAELLAGRGEVLLARADSGGGLEVAAEAVRELRAALALTVGGELRLAERQLLFGRALHRHHTAGGAATDLHEARVDPGPRGPRRPDGPYGVAGLAGARRGAADAGRRDRGAGVAGSGG